MPEMLEIEARLRNFISKDIEKIQADLKRLQGNVKNVDADLKSAEAAARKFGNTTKKSFSAADKASNSFTKGVKDIATRFGPAALAVGVFTKAIGSLSNAIETLRVATTQLEKEMSAVKAILIPTTAEFIELERTARTLGQTTVFTATESAKAFVQMGKRGFEAAQIIKASSGVLDLAAGTMTDMSLAAATTVATLNQFNLVATESRRVVDVMGKAFNTSALDMFTFSEGMKMAGPIAGTVGTKLEELTAAMAVLADREIKGTLAGTAMRRMLLELADENSKVSKAIDLTGIEANTLTEKLRVLSMMNLTLGETTDFFTIRAVAAADILIKNVDAMEELNIQYENADGTMKRMADTMLDNLAGATILLKSAQEELGITIGQSFSDEKRKRMEIAIQRTRWWTKFLDENSESLERMSKWLGFIIEMIVGTLDVALKALMGTLVALFTPIDTLGKFFDRVFGFGTVENIDNVTKALSAQERVVVDLDKKLRLADRKQIKTRIRTPDADPDAVKKAAEQLLKSQQLLADAQINIMEKGIEKELAKVKEKFSRLIAENKGNSKAIINIRKAEAIEVEKVISDEFNKTLNAFMKMTEERTTKEKKAAISRTKAENLANEQQIEAEKVLRNFTLQAMEDGAKKQLAIQEAIDNDMIEQLIANEDTITAIKTAAEKERGELLKEIKIQNAIDIATQAIGAASQVGSAIINLSRQSREQELSDEKARINAMKITQKEKDKLLKKAEISNKNKAKKEKAIALGLAVVNTALAVTSAIASAKSNTEKIIMGVLIGALGAVEIATIASQKFAGGGIVGGNSPVGDSNVIAANTNEVVLNGRQQAELLFNIANGGGGTTNNSANTNVVFNISGDATPEALDRMDEVADRLGKVMVEANRSGALNDFKNELATEGIFS